MIYDDERVMSADLNVISNNGTYVYAVAVGGENKVVRYADYDAFARDEGGRELADGEQVCFEVGEVSGGGYGFPCCVAGWVDFRSGGGFVAVYCYRADVPRFMWYE